MIPDCRDCGGTGRGTARGRTCSRCDGSGVEPLEIPDGGIDPPLDTLTEPELPEWLTSMHGDCPQPSALHKVLDPARVIIEWPCGLSLVLHNHRGDIDYAERHDEALAKAEHVLRLQRGIVTMKATRLPGVSVSGGSFTSSGGFAAPMDPSYDLGEAGPEMVMPTVRAPRGKIEFNMTLSDEGASLVKELWEKGHVTSRAMRRLQGYESE